MPPEDEHGGDRKTGVGEGFSNSVTLLRVVRSGLLISVSGANQRCLVKTQGHVKVS